ncbi:MAG: LysR family transcriptional regulator [Selenomonadaceae bacterium]|nr:LysR family transcriptional regulator [Selenomonadaceae bacterium]
MIETYLLEYLVELEKNKTLSDAAKKLFVTQSALSRSMQKLEKILGVEIFSRKKILLP